MASGVATHANEVVVREQAREQRTSAETLPLCTRQLTSGLNHHKSTSSAVYQQQNKQLVYLMGFLCSVKPVPTVWDASRNSGSCLERGSGIDIDIDIDVDAEKLLG